MGIKCLFADPQFVRQIVHGHTAESVTEKVRPRRMHYPLPNRRVLSGSRRGFIRRRHRIRSAAVNRDVPARPNACFRSLSKRIRATGSCSVVAG
jgi:hypothetical protein